MGKKITGICNQNVLTPGVKSVGLYQPEEENPLFYKRVVLFCNVHGLFKNFFECAYN